MPVERTRTHDTSWSRIGVGVWPPATAILRCAASRGRAPNLPHIKQRRAALARPARHGSRGRPRGTQVRDGGVAWLAAPGGGLPAPAGHHGTGQAQVVGLPRAAAGVDHAAVSAVARLLQLLRLLRPTRLTTA